MYYQIKGLVLNTKIVGEADKIAMLYSLEWGKIQVVVPSAKKITAKLSSATEPLTESEFMVFQSHPSMRAKVTGAHIINNHSKLKTDFKRNLYGLYAAEISDKLVPFNMENEQKYNLISRIWEILAKCEFPRRALIAFILRFLKLSGYAFSDYIQHNGQSLDTNTQKIIKKLSNCSGEEVDNLVFDEEKIWNYVESYLSNYIKKSHVGTFLKKLNNY